MTDQEIPVMKEDACTCGSKTCGAVRHIEDLSHDLDELRREVRLQEKCHREDCNHIWFKLGILMVAIAAVLPTGWASFLGMI